MMSIALKVDGMTCEHCERAVAQALSEVPGVTRVVEVTRERGEAIVDGEPEMTQLIAAVKAEGYEARVA
jgi:copper chaperone